VDELRALLDQTASLAAEFYETLDERPVYRAPASTSCAPGSAARCRRRPPTRGR
jgi:hypothetical protein